MATAKKPQVKQPEIKTTPVKKEPAITLTKEQYAELRDIAWRNSIDELEEIGVGGEDDMRALGFTLGTAYNSLKAQFEKMQEILDEIEPAGYNDFSVEEDDDNF